MDLIHINMKDAEPLKTDTCKLMSTQLDWIKATNQEYYNTLPVKAYDPSWNLVDIE